MSISALIVFIQILALYKSFAYLLTYLLTIQYYITGKPSEPTDVVVPKNPFTKPSPPGQPSVDEIRKDSATLSWTPPKDTGNCPITNYIVEFRPVGGFQWTVANLRKTVAQPSYTVTGLKEETQYEFRVSAENKVGQSAPSDVSSAKYGKRFHHNSALSRF